jgi:hypothetical protein
MTALLSGHLVGRSYSIQHYTVFKATVRPDKRGVESGNNRTVITFWLRAAPQKRQFFDPNEPGPFKLT